VVFTAGVKKVELMLLVTWNGHAGHGSPGVRERGLEVELAGLAQNQWRGKNVFVVE
jgi:hypothetical protein